MFTAYPTYSMSILWNMDARQLNRDAGLFADIPVDGDAPARARGRIAKNAGAWATLRRDALELLRNNHHDSDKVDAR